MLQKIKECADYIQPLMPNHPTVGIILGSGLGGLVDEVKIEKEIPYHSIPHFLSSTVQGHQGSLVLGSLNEVDVLIMSGRFHYYEGYDLKEVTFPIHVMKALGVKTVILSNAAGGMNPDFQVGDMMLIRDHINLFGTNPLLGPNNDELGPRFPDMSQAYSKRLIALALQTAAEWNIPLQQGVYVGVSGPCFETPAEYRMYHILGADAVGMSTVPETIVARYIGLEVFAISVITDLGIGNHVEAVSHEEVLSAAQKAGQKMVQLVREMLPKI